MKKLVLFVGGVKWALICLSIINKVLRREIDKTKENITNIKKKIDE